MIYLEFDGGYLRYGSTSSGSSTNIRSRQTGHDLRDNNGLGLLFFATKIDEIGVNSTRTRISSCFCCFLGWAIYGACR
jgi:hypothetical protein